MVGSWGILSWLPHFSVKQDLRTELRGGIKEMKVGERGKGGNITGQGEVAGARTAWAL